MSAINIEKLYLDGFSTGFLDAPTIAFLGQLIQREEWVCDPDKVYGRVPKWSTEITSHSELSPQLAAENRAELNKKANPFYARTLERFLNQPSILGNAAPLGEVKIQFVHLWDGAEDLTWHWDGFAYGGYFMTVYLTEDNWDPAWGGQIVFGSRSLEDTDWPNIARDVDVAESINPDNGRFVIGNNLNPRQVHKVVPLTQNKPRFTIMAGLDFVK